MTRPGLIQASIRTRPLSNCSFPFLAGETRAAGKVCVKLTGTRAPRWSPFLRKMPAFAAARVVQQGRLGIRDGGRVRGEYCLTGDDVRQLRKFADVACRGCWPIEYWDQRRGVSLEYLPDGGYYEIPLRACVSRS